MASLAQAFSSGQPTFSFELFPPKTAEGEVALWQTIADLERLRPDFVSITYGAGGSTRDRTIRITQEILERTNLATVAHLTCVGASRDELGRIIDQYADAGIRNILALRGDPAGGLGSPWVRHPGGMDHAVELVEFIRERGPFTVGVAAFPEGHPESDNLDVDAQVLRAKQDAGAVFAVTQFFFRIEDYAELVGRARDLGCTIPIIPGLMPVTNVTQIERFAALSGAAFPPELAERFNAVKDDDHAVRELGVELSTELGAALLDAGAPGLHFYTLNRSTSTRRVYEALISRGQ
jgi:methylenetetrahydrofolate reductase (NADPH)